MEVGDAIRTTHEGAWSMETLLYVSTLVSPHMTRTLRSWSDEQATEFDAHLDLPDEEQKRIFLAAKAEGVPPFWMDEAQFLEIVRRTRTTRRRGTHASGQLPMSTDDL